MKRDCRPLRPSMKNDVVINKSDSAQNDLLSTRVTYGKDYGKEGMDENRVNNYE
jgi:hypothetical protein